MDEELLAEIKRLLDEQLAASSFTIPGEAGGLVRQGPEDAPYYVPGPKVTPQFTEAPPPAPAPITDFGPSDVPIPEALPEPSPFEIAAERIRRSVRPDQGRQEAGLTSLIENAGPSALQALNELAKGATEQSNLAALGEDYDPKALIDAAMTTAPIKPAILMTGGMIAAPMAAKKLQAQGGPAATAEDLAKLLIPSAAAAQPMTDQQRIIEAARRKMAPQPITEPEPMAPQGQPVPTVENAPNNIIKRAPKKPVKRSKETDEQYAGRLAEFEKQKAEFYRQYTPTARRVLDTVGGPKVVKDSDYAGMGVLAALTAGMILAPKVYQMFKFSRVPVGRAVKDAMPGTEAFSGLGDLARTGDSMSQAVIGLGRKNGINPQVADHLDKLFGTYTRSGARYLSEAGVETGTMRTNAFTFTAPMSLAEMEAKFTPAMRQYIVALDTFERIVNKSRLPQHTPTMKNPTPGPAMVAGHTAQSLGPVIRAMEKADPQVIDAAKMWREWNKSVRDFQSKGEYATIPTKNTNQNPAIPSRSVAFMNAQHKYEVPWFGRKEAAGMSMDERIASQDPIKMQTMYSKINLRERLENEAVGQYVDNMIKAQPNSFVRVGRNAEETAEILKDNPHYVKNAVSFYRRGVKETYTTDPFLADALKMDPPVVTSGAGNIIYAAKRATEFTATGLGAPMFAPTSLLRNWLIGKMSAERGMWTPALVGSLRVIPQQLYPQLAKGIASSIDYGVLSRFAGKPWVDSLAQTLAKHYDNSLYAQLKQVGTARGSILEHERMSTGLEKLGAAIQRYSGPARPFLNSYKNLLESIHNGPAFDYVRRNLKTVDQSTGKTITLPDLAHKARSLTGDPRTAGQYYFKDAGNINRPIRFQSDGVTHTAGEVLTRGYLGANEFGRTAVPWFNATQQGIKGIGQAYLRDPVLFTRNMWLYAGMPAASLYLYSHSLGKDPNGQSYVDYALNRRSAYNTQMNWYIPIPGQPAEMGMEVPFFHELAPVKRMMEIGMDHMFGNADNSLAHDYWRAAHAFVDTAVTPPLPPVIGGPMALYGIQPPMGAFGGEAYQIKTDPFDQYQGMPSNIEAFTRALGTSMSQVIGAGFAAYSNTPEGFAAGVANGLKQGSKLAVEKTPLIRDIARMLPPMSGNTDTRVELFQKQKEIDQLLKYYQGFDKGAGQINTKAASGGGANIADDMLGSPISSESPGIAQPRPTNPLYQQFMADVYNRFKKDSPTFVNGEDSGGIGFRSLWRRYGDATAALKSLRRVDAGNYVTWQNQLEQRKGVTEELKNNGVDTSKLNEVRNYYTMKQQDAARIILKTIKAVEAEFSAKAGRPITIKDINPYVEPGPAPFAYPDVVQETQQQWGGM